MHGGAGEARSPIKAKRGLDRLEISRILANGAFPSSRSTLYSRHMPSMRKNIPRPVTRVGAGKAGLLLVTRLLEETDNGSGKSEEEEKDALHLVAKPFP